MLEDPLSGNAKLVHQEPEKEIGGPCWQFGGRSFVSNPKNSDQVVVLFGAVSEKTVLILDAKSSFFFIIKKNSLLM